MKKLLMISGILLGIGVHGYAQSGVIAKANADAVANYDGVAGIFTYPLSATERLSVSYGITPKHPVSTAVLTLHTPDPMPLSAKIFNAVGTEVLHWVPAKKVYLYQESLNVSSFPAGLYTVKLYMGSDPKEIHSFNFTKQ